MERPSKVERTGRGHPARRDAHTGSGSGGASIPDLRASTTVLRQLATSVGKSPSLQRQAALVQHIGQGRRRGAPSGSTGLVIQRGAKYDKLKEAAEKDSDGGDYEFKTLTEDAIQEGTLELLGEHLVGKKYLDLDGKELALPKVMLSASWGGAEGVVLLPARLQSALQILTGEFAPNLMHEVGHMVKGRTDAPTMKSAIATIAQKARDEAGKPDYKDAKPDAAAWEEEVRADLTGVYLRKTAGSAPTKAEYNALAWADDAADGEHPPGAYRIARIHEYIDLLG